MVSLGTAPLSNFEELLFTFLAAAVFVRISCTMKHSVGKMAAIAAELNMAKAIGHPKFSYTGPSKI